MPVSINRCLQSILYVMNPGTCRTDACEGDGLTCPGSDSPVLGVTHLSWERLTCLGSDSPVLGATHLSWESLTCPGSHSPVLGAIHLSWDYSPILGVTHLSCERLTYPGSDSPVLGVTHLSRERNSSEAEPSPAWWSGEAPCSPLEPHWLLPARSLMRNHCAG
ncbi:hypothetical protein Bbelb_313000 [Branchiostoma belcheri]|nr:hypothetical protein Bbelb_313000 [Branchiostoma belcheri]